MARENRPNALWPVGTKVFYSDAWGRNPVEGSIKKHYGETNVLVEDVTGVVHFGPTWRIETDPPARPRPSIDLDDLIGGAAADLLDDLLV